MFIANGLHSSYEILELLMVTRHKLAIMSVLWYVCYSLGRVLITNGIDFFILLDTGLHCIALESSFRSHRSKTCHPRWPVRLVAFDVLLRAFANFFGSRVKPMLEWRSKYVGSPGFYAPL